MLELLETADDTLNLQYSDFLFVENNDYNGNTLVKNDDEIDSVLTSLNWIFHLLTTMQCVR